MALKDSRYIQYTYIKNKTKPKTHTPKKFKHVEFKNFIIQDEIRLTGNVFIVHQVKKSVVKYNDIK